jgi:hypothetical protein
MELLRQKIWKKKPTTIEQLIKILVKNLAVARFLKSESVDNCNDPKHDFAIITSKQRRRPPYMEKRMHKQCTTNKHQGRHAWTIAIINKYDSSSPRLIRLDNRDHKQIWLIDVASDDSSTSRSTCISEHRCKQDLGKIRVYKEDALLNASSIVNQWDVAWSVKELNDINLCLEREIESWDLKESSTRTFVYKLMPLSEKFILRNLNIRVACSGTRNWNLRLSLNNRNKGF